MKKGLFITFEGIDGCGKTTQLTMLADYLKQNGHKVLITREPGGKGLGEEIRKILLNFDGQVSSTSEAFLFLADRAQNIDMIIKPAVEEGFIVLCDRHADSTVAYQGYGRQLNPEQLVFLNNIATSNFKPDLTLVFDIDVKTALARVGKHMDRMELSGIDFFERTRNGYFKIAENEPNRIKIINSDNTIENINQEVITLFNSLFNRNN